MKKVNAKLTIPKLRTVCKYQQNAAVKKGDGHETDPTTTSNITISDILIGGW
ncbi:hypothetical protein HQ865_00665 [Mucilaginibacter mali]|uniref:Uncharacterized protein n=1 Tax=Mucilaginibacter mali TaxID=2740462 RepID=A0A7D4Q577_9SPHI|nr:hypothetical protein [Mucilaginibacter mali]QKJ28331.1 hypothetical protein HQ865_00665 [Mucilaginibacter mali]